MRLGTNGPGSSAATDLVAALAYDLEAGRPNARAEAYRQLDAMAAALAPGRQQLAASDSVRRATQRPLRHPLADLTGSSDNEAFGTIAFEVAGDRLRFRWGVLEGPCEVFDAETDRLRFEIAGNGNTAAFRFDGPGGARSVAVGGVTFVRR